MGVFVVQVDDDKQAISLAPLYSTLSTPTPGGVAVTPPITHLVSLYFAQCCEELLRSLALAGTQASCCRRAMIVADAAWRVCCNVLCNDSVGHSCLSDTVGRHVYRGPSFARRMPIDILVLCAPVCFAHVCVVMRINLN
jgi:hypothetical protein